MVVTILSIIILVLLLVLGFLINLQLQLTFKMNALKACFNETGKVWDELVELYDEYREAETVDAKTPIVSKILDVAANVHNRYYKLKRKYDEYKRNNS